jgi:hypothetical protein
MIEAAPVRVNINAEVDQEDVTPNGMSLTYLLVYDVSN